MTDKQKQAIIFINELNYDRKVITNEEYFLLMEFIVGNNAYIMDKELEDYSRKNIVNVPFVRTVSFPECYSPDGVCSNPFRDCVNCPRMFGSGGTTVTTTNINDNG